MEDTLNGLFEKRKKFNQVQFIAVGFLIMIAVGTLLLMLPISSKSGEWTDPLSALFTATSTSCVTGLAVVDTFTHWSGFGQVVLLTLIQIGGLGFITIGVSFAVLFRRKIGLRQRDLLRESVNALELGGIIRLWRKIVGGTFIFEGIGAILLAIRFIPEFGFGYGLYMSVFHSVSAFCNAGFDLMGQKEAYSSFSSYVNDPLVNIVVCSLIIIGSLGFIVWKDLVENGFHWTRYKLHTKIVLLTTAVLVIGGTVLMYIFERNYTIAEMSVSDGILASFFGSVTTRTAGFNTVDTAALSPAGKLITIMLMFIGGSPGSTAGGVKTTTIAVLAIFVFTSLRNSSGCNVFKRRISEEIIRKASMVFLLNLVCALVGALIILGTSNLAFDDVIFETISAVSTVGMTTGITRSLNVVSRIVIVILMYVGRVGSMTFALSLIQRPSGQATTLPEEKITIG